MNRTDQFHKGFKTFLLTLSISLIVFSIAYYVVTSASIPDSYALNNDIESEDEIGQVVEQPEPQTVFQELAAQKLDVPERAVLAATDTQETTQSTTPDGGVASITVGLITSIAVFLFGLWVVANDPRRAALSDFEKRIRQGL